MRTSKCEVRIKNIIAYMNISTPKNKSRPCLCKRSVLVTCHHELDIHCKHTSSVYTAVVVRVPKKKNKTLFYMTLSIWCSLLFVKVHNKKFEYIFINFLLLLLFTSRHFCSMAFVTVLMGYLCIAQP